MTSVVAHDRSLELAAAHKGTVTRSETNYKTVVAKKGGCILTSKHAERSWLKLGAA